MLAYLLGLGCIDSRQGGGRVVALLGMIGHHKSLESFMFNLILCVAICLYFINLGLIFLHSPNAASGDPAWYVSLYYFQITLVVFRLIQKISCCSAQSISEFADALNNMEHHPGIKTVRVELLTGSVTGSTRDELLNRLETVSDDDAVFLIGTHALVTPDIVERLKNLPSVSSAKGKGVALSIVDEEHRFGVRQRQSLAMCAAHTLYMSATPIPRTISLRGTTGLIDFSLLESEPRAVETTIVSSDMIERVATTLGTKINAGSKCFWVLPRIGDDEKAETEESISQQSNVLDRHKMLSDAFGKDRVGFVHGRMKVKEREAMLARFADPSSTVDVLVSTTVIEGELI